MQKCACGSNLEFHVCCEPYLKGRSKPPTAEALMRSRYTAFTVGDVAYIEKTTDPSTREDFDRAGTSEWAKQSEWKGLKILSTTAGGEADSSGEVEFVASYKFENIDRQHHERSQFKKRDGQWYFLDGKIVQAPVRAEDKPGRNDPCSCGSGKKYKKCCGA